MSSLSSLSLDTTSSVLLGGVVLLCVWWWRSTRRPPGLPPGPGLALPLLGHLHLLAKDPRPQFWTWRRQYGDVFSLTMGGRLTVVLASYAAFHEALQSLADVFTDRPKNLILDKFFSTKGIVAASGPQWKTQRKTAMECLRDMGMGKNLLAEKIQEEVTHYIRAIKDHQGAPVDLSRMTEVSVSNNICSITLGQRFDYHDPQFIGHLRCISDNFKLMAGTAIQHYLPILGYLPGDPFHRTKALANMEDTHRFVGQHVDDHQTARADGHVERTDFIFHYLHRIGHSKSRGVGDAVLDEESMAEVVVDLFNAGSETTSTAVLWALLFLLHNPHVQNKCFQEISDVIGPHRLPSMRDKPKLTYVEATIYEVLRKADIGPLSLHHATARDVRFRNYDIPKGTVVIPFLSCILQDPDIWGDPEHFRPERFIDQDGKLTAPKEFIPFGIGRRMCLGESLARMELFLYLTTLIQHFRFLPTEEGKLPSLEGVLGITYTPKPFQIRAVPRV